MVWVQVFRCAAAGGDDWVHPVTNHGLHGRPRKSESLLTPAGGLWYNSSSVLLTHLFLQDTVNFLVLLFLDDSPVCPNRWLLTR